MKSICFILTSPLALNAFLLGHLRALADEYLITVCTNTVESPVSKGLDSRVEVIDLPILRQISPIQDFTVLIRLIRLIRSRNFDAVHSLTPKGGLLAMLAARICGTRVRTHIFTGQVWATRTGWIRRFLMALDRLLCHCATDLHADSQSQARFLEDAAICGCGRIQVFGSGSISGFDVNRFASAAGRRSRVRRALGIDLNAPVFLFLGRLQHDKGVFVLADAFVAVLRDHPNARLILAGPDEQHLAASLVAQCGEPCIAVGLTSHPEDYIDAADVLCLPSFREGFGSVIIEAAGMGVPAVASRIYGLTDAVVDGSTGFLCPPGDAVALADSMKRILSFDTLTRMRADAQLRAHKEFTAERLIACWLEYYNQKLGPSN